MGDRRESIMLVEDNIDDVLFARRAFKKAAVANELVIFHYGDEALTYLLEQRDGVPHPPRPHVGAVFLDIHVPRVSGLEVLERLRAEAGLQSLPVFMLSGSDDPVGIERARSLGAKAYLVKPPLAGDLLRVLRASGWLGLRIEGE